MRPDVNWTSKEGKQLFEEGQTREILPSLSPPADHDQS